MSEYQLLFDVWEGQLEIDEAAVRAGGVRGLFIRINKLNGGTSKDEYFDVQWQQAGDAGLLRAPYFVFNPWQSGQSNFDWLFAHAPAGVKLIAVDVEVVYSAVSPSKYAAELKRFVELARSKWSVVIYTAEWFLPYLSSWPSGDYWWAQYPYSLYPGGAQHWTYAQLRSVMDTLTVPSNASKIPGTLKVWQCSGDRLILPGTVRPVDVNLFRGSQQQLADWMGGTLSEPEPPLPDEEHTEPYAGVKYDKVKRFGVWAHVTRISPAAGARFHVTKYGLARVSSVAKGLGAQIVTNGGDFNGSSAVGLHVSEGRKYSPQLEWQPYLNLTSAQRAEIRDYSSTEYYNALAGKRLLVVDGKVSTATSSDWSGRHPRTLAGVAADGTLVLIVSDGRRYIDGVYREGLDLYESAAVLIEFGAVRATDLDGGGSSAMWLKDKIVNVPSDGDERYVGTHIAVFLNEGAPTVDYRYSASSAYSRALRNGSSVLNSNIGTIPAGAIVYGNELFVAPKDVYSGGVKMQKAGDVWLHVLQIGTQQVDGWTSITHLGKAQMLLTDHSTPVPADNEIVKAVVYFADGTTQELLP